MTRIALEGEVDFETSPGIRKTLLAAIARGNDVTVDLSRVSYIDSSGIASLIEARQAAKRLGHRFRIVKASKAVCAMFGLKPLNRIFGTCCRHLQSRMPSIGLLATRHKNEPAAGGDLRHPPS